MIDVFVSRRGLKICFDIVRASEEGETDVWAQGVPQFLNSCTKCQFLVLWHVVSKVVVKLCE
jgi:hypothetical protein